MMLNMQICASSVTECTARHVSRQVFGKTSTGFLIIICSLYCIRSYSLVCPSFSFISDPCDEYVCVNCREMTECLQCEDSFCNDHILTCQNCHSDGCPVCATDTSDEVEGCDLCGKSFCFECRRQECENDWNECCSGCLRLIAPLLNNAYNDEQL